MVNPGRMLKVLSAKLPIIESLLCDNDPTAVISQKAFTLNILETPVQKHHNGICLASCECYIVNENQMWMPSFDNFISVPNISCAHAFGSYVLCGGA